MRSARSGSGGAAARQRRPRRRIRRRVGSTAAPRAHAAGDLSAHPAAPLRRWYASSAVIGRWGRRVRHVSAAAASGPMKARAASAPPPSYPEEAEVPAAAPVDRGGLRRRRGRRGRTRPPGTLLGVPRARDVLELRCSTIPARSPPPLPPPPPPPPHRRRGLVERGRGLGGRRRGEHLLGERRDVRELGRGVHARENPAGGAPPPAAAGPAARRSGERQRAPRRRRPRWRRRRHRRGGRAGVGPVPRRRADRRDGSEAAAASCTASAAKLCELLGSVCSSLPAWATGSQRVGMRRFFRRRRARDRSPRHCTGSASVGGADASTAKLGAPRLRLAGRRIGSTEAGTTAPAGGSGSSASTLLPSLPLLLLFASARER